MGYDIYDPRDDYKVNSFVRQVDGRSNFRKGEILQIVKRQSRGRRWWRQPPAYFVVALGHPAGYGCWLGHDKIQPLSALELLGAQVAAST